MAEKRSEQPAAVAVDGVADEDLAWLERQMLEKAAILDWLADH